MIDFPASPTVGQQFTAAGVTWTYDGTKWGLTSAVGAPITVSAVAPSSPVAGSLWFDTNGGQMYVWYNDGTSSQWVPVVNQGSSASSSSSGSLLVPPPVAASWTQRNFNAGVTTLTDVANGVALYSASSSGSIVNTLRAATMAVPATPYTIDVNFCSLSTAINNAYIKLGALWSDGTKAQVLTTLLLVGTSLPSYNIENYSALSTYAALAAGPIYSFYNYGNLWMRLADNGTNVTFSFSNDGVAWMPVYTIAKASGYLGASGYSNVGFFLNEQVMGSGGSGNMTVQSWRIH